MGKEGVSGKEMFPYQKTETAGGVARGVKDLQPHISKRDFLAILKQDLRLHRQSFHVQSMDSYRDSKSGLQF